MSPIGGTREPAVCSCGVRFGGPAVARAISVVVRARLPGKCWRSASMFRATTGRRAFQVASGPCCPNASSCLHQSRGCQEAEVRSNRSPVLLYVPHSCWAAAKDIRDFAPHTLSRCTHYRNSQRRISNNSTRHPESRFLRRLNGLILCSTSCGQCVNIYSVRCIHGKSLFPYENTISTTIFLFKKNFNFNIYTF